MSSIDPDDFCLSPFTQRGGLGNLSAIALATAEANQPARRPVRRSPEPACGELVESVEWGEGGSFSEVGLFDEQLPKLLNELNEVLAA